MPKEADLTQAYLAEAVGVTREYMRMMRGEPRSSDRTELAVRYVV